MTSKRSKKKQVAAGVRSLRQKPGWDPSRRPNTQLDPLQELGNTERTGKAYEEAAQCPQCEKARRAAKDSTQLCDAHLAEALGI